MSTTSQKTKTGFVADSLAVGVLVMFAMTVIQRGLGFLRGIWFCRVLDDTSVGAWSMAYDFIEMMTPILLLGLPGCLPRYAEAFREQGHLPSLVRRLGIATAILAGVCLLALTSFPSLFAWLVFLDVQQTSMIQAMAIAILIVVVFNFVRELVSSLRQVRVVSQMQFLQSVGFTIASVSWLATDGSLTGLVYCFSLATIIALLPGVLVLRAGWSGLPDSSHPFDARAMWRRVLPFAITLWSMNLLNNAFALSDRYMILHWLPGTDAEAQAAIGQYHSGRIFPMLLASLAAMLGSILLPYLSADWEKQRRESVTLRLRQILFALSLVFSVVAASLLILSPWIFGTLLQGRYAAGLSLMPMAFVFCIWVALATVGENYLWVLERGKLATLAMGVGLAANIGLNLLLLPIWGLHGAVVATLLANFVMLCGTWWGMHRHGYPFDETALYATVLPLTLLVGPWVTLVSAITIIASNPQVRAWLADLRK
ncbi:MAG: oligosaccharide flippase family protein [Planctomycetota bacterium]